MSEETPAQQPATTSHKWDPSKDPTEEQLKRVYITNIDYNASWQDLKSHMAAVGEVEFADLFQERGGWSRGCGVVEYFDSQSAERAIAELNDTKLGDRNIIIRRDLAQEWKGKENRRWKDRRARQKQHKEALAAAREEAAKRKDDKAREKGLPLPSELKLQREATAELNALAEKAFDAAGVVFANDPEMLALWSQYGEAWKWMMSQQSWKSKSRRGKHRGTVVYIGNLPYTSTWHDVKGLMKEQDIDAHIQLATDGWTGQSRGFATAVCKSQESAKACVDKLNGREFHGRKLFVREDKFADKPRGAEESAAGAPPELQSGDWPTLG
mmetsp:Transcript_85523/g.228769  ORF Transcript_85523/g.228769 Transcript_85523/m.228769 type:complete len:326 (+) Transcript_85523:32-1009(+)